MLSLVQKLICKENPLRRIIEGASLSTESKVSFALLRMMRLGCRGRRREN